MAQLAEKKYYSPEEYLAREETAEYKSEYYRGEIFALAGTSVNHNQNLPIYQVFYHLPLLAHP